MFYKDFFEFRVVLEVDIMERVHERQNFIIDEFKCRYQGRTSPFSWDNLEGSISLYSESCEGIIERLQRKRSLENDISLSTLMFDLHQKLLKVISDDVFPVCSNYRKIALNWLQRQFSEDVNSDDLKNYQELKYVYKTYQVTSSENVTCLEETNKMGNKDGTTGLVTWQGALGLLNFVTQGQNVLPPKAKILELGSGAGLFGLGLLKTSEEIFSYIFTDENTKVLDSIVTNFNINFNLSKCSSEDMDQWLENGPLVNIFETSEVLQSGKGDSRIVQVKRLDWLNASNDLIASLDYNIIFGSDLTYTPALLKPLALLLKRLLTAKIGQNISAYIACTHRCTDTIKEFLGHMVDLGLQPKAALRTTFGPQDGCVVGHEPLHSYTVFKVTVGDKANIDSKNST